MNPLIGNMRFFFFCDMTLLIGNMKSLRSDMVLLVGQMILPLSNTKLLVNIIVCVRERGSVYERESLCV